MSSRILSIKKSLQYYKRLQKAHRLFRSQRSANGGNLVHFYNWWEPLNEQEWFTKFFQSRGLIYKNTKLNLCSVFGDRLILDFVPHPKIFFTGENVKNYCPEYADHYLSTSDLSLGMEFFENDKYLRFPLWIRYIVPPEARSTDIDMICQRLRNPTIDNKNKFLSIISRHDSNGLKSQIYNALNCIGTIYCPSQFNHNDNTLVELFQDNKVNYLKQFFFNACPENTNCYGYVTEKLFESILAGCIPIYWGSCGDPEKYVLNNDAIIHWNKDGDNTDNINLIYNLFSNKDLLIKFASQPRLSNTANEYINDTISDFECRIRKMLQ